MLIELYGGDAALQLFNSFDLPFLENLISQTQELRRDPKEKEQQRRAKASANLNNWLKNTNLGEVVITAQEEDGSTRQLTLEQINNFEF